MYFPLQNMAPEGAVMEKTRSSIEHVDKLIKKRRFKRKVRIQLRRNVEPFSVTLERLFHCCQNVFKGYGTAPSSGFVQEMCHILDAMKPEDVGLTRDMPFLKLNSEAEGTPIVTSSTIYKCDDFELCLFFLPPKAVIPLHNHPEMTVFSKLLFGNVHIKAYDWVDPHNSRFLNSPCIRRLAKLKANRTFTPSSDATVLYPTSGGNIHEFTAITPCVLLDVIGPPYATGSYYKDIPYSKLDEKEVKIKDEDDNYGWLEEIEAPEESKMEPIEYKGPRIRETLSYPS